MATAAAMLSRSPPVIIVSSRATSKVRAASSTAPRRSVLGPRAAGGSGRGGTYSTRPGTNSPRPCFLNLAFVPLAAISRVIAA